MALKTLLEELVERKNMLMSAADEKNTENYLIAPFLRGLGYDPSDPRKIISQYDADPGDRKTGKIDYAILDKKRKPVIYVECKKLLEPLDQHHNQIKRYFNNKLSVKFAILTNGSEFRFYTDLDNKNVLDRHPFLSLHLDNFTDEDITKLSIFKAENFDVTKARSIAEELRYSSKILRYLQGQFKQPNDEFIKFIASVVLNSRSKYTLDIVKPLLPSVFDEILKKNATPIRGLIGKEDTLVPKVIEPKKLSVKPNSISTNDEESGEAVNIFQVKNPTHKVLEYFIFDDKKIHTRKIVDMQVYVSKELLKVNPNLFRNNDHRLISTNPGKFIRPSKLLHEYYLETNTSSKDKFKFLKKMLEAMSMKDELLVKLVDRK